MFPASSLIEPTNFIVGVASGGSSSLRVRNICLLVVDELNHSADSISISTLFKNALKSDPSSFTDSPSMMSSKPSLIDFLLLDCAIVELITVSPVRALSDPEGTK